MEIRLSLHHSNPQYFLSGDVDIGNYGKFKGNEDIVYIPYMKFFNSILMYERTIAHSFIEILACVLTNTSLNEIKGKSLILEMLAKHKGNNKAEYDLFYDKINSFIKRNAKSFIKYHADNNFNILIERNDYVSHFHVMRSSINQLLSSYRNTLMKLFGTNDLSLGSKLLNKLDNVSLDDKIVFTYAQTVSLNIDISRSKYHGNMFILNHILINDSKISESIISFVDSINGKITNLRGKILLPVLDKRKDFGDCDIGEIITNVVYSMFASHLIYCKIGTTDVANIDSSAGIFDITYTHICSIFDALANTPNRATFGLSEEYNHFRKVFDYIFNESKSNEASERFKEMHYLNSISPEFMVERYSEIVSEYFSEVKDLLGF